MSTTKKLAQVLHYDLQGKREFKYNFLNENSLASIAWNKLEPCEPNYFLVKKNFDESEMYEKGFKMDELFIIFTSGIKTHDDGNLINSNKFSENNQVYYYRPFDTQNINYDLNKVQRHRFSVMKNMLKPNIGLLFPRQAITELFGFFITKGLTDINYTGTAGQFGAGLTFPLYIYPDDNGQQTIDQTTQRTPNLNTDIVNQIATKLGLAFTTEKETTKGTFAPIDILDYLYAILHSPTYREKYKEFLKIDFPRVPYPKDAEFFWQLVKLGAEIRQIHLLESAVVEKYITQYPIDGDNVVGKITFVLNDYDGLPTENEPLRNYTAVYINDTQFFGNVPLEAWEFYIGGYQPAQKWLKDRKGRALEFDDILHYQKIIVALTETSRLMKEIDKIEIE